MTDLQKFQQLFDSIGLQYVIKPTKMDGSPTVTQMLRINEGVGYSNFFTEFYFNADGKFVEHGCYE